jgi:hypothetical protein
LAVDIILERVISGGQTGADRAGLDAAFDNKIPTGGTAPKHYMTENGPDLSLRDKFGLKEGLVGYANRTMCNVRDSDGTVIFGHTTSPGSAKTIYQCALMERPYILNPDVYQLVKWLLLHQIRVLNVAGNRASKNEFVYHDTYEVIDWTIHQLRNPGLFT